MTYTFEGINVKLDDITSIEQPEGTATLYLMSGETVVEMVEGVTEPGDYLAIKQFIRREWHVTPRAGYRTNWFVYTPK